MRIPSALAAALLAFAPMWATSAAAKDVYKAYLDPQQFAHHRAAVDTIEKLKENPKDPALHNDLGCLIARDGFWKDALREFDEAARLDKHFSKPLFNAGLVHASKGEWHAARRSFKKAVDRDGGNWTAWWMLGFAEEKLGSTNAAVDSYARSLRVDTGLFDVARNPFAAETKLRGRVLLQTYESRIMRASLPSSEQIAEPARIATFFQRSSPAAASAAEPVAEAPAPDQPAQTGPVVTTAPAPGSPGAPRSGSTPGNAGDRIRFRPVTPRGGTPPRPPDTANEPPPNGALAPPRRRIVPMPPPQQQPQPVVPVPPPQPEPTPEPEEQ